MKKPKYKAGDRLFFFPQNGFDPYPRFFGAEVLIKGHKMFHGWPYYIGSLLLHGKEENFSTFAEEHFAKEDLLDVEFF